MAKLSEYLKQNAKIKININQNGLCLFLATKQSHKTLANSLNQNSAEKTKNGKIKLRVKVYKT